MQVTLKTAVAKSETTCFEDAGVEHIIFAESAFALGEKPAVDFVVTWCLTDGLFLLAAAHGLFRFLALLLGDSSSIVPLDKYFEQKDPKYIVLGGHTRYNFHGFL